MDILLTSEPHYSVRDLHSGRPSYLTQIGGVCADLQPSYLALPFSNERALVAQLKASLAEQLSVEQLRDEFRRYIKTKVAQELVDFYLDSLDREEVTGYFKRQVKMKPDSCYPGCRSSLHVGVEAIVFETRFTDLPLFSYSLAQAFLGPERT